MLKINSNNGWQMWWELFSKSKVHYFEFCNDAHEIGWVHPKLDDEFICLCQNDEFDEIAWQLLFFYLYFSQMNGREESTLKVICQKVASSDSNLNEIV